MKRVSKNLIRFIKQQQKNNEITLHLFYPTESNHSNIGEENSQHDLSEILSQSAIPIAKK